MKFIFIRVQEPEEFAFKLLLNAENIYVTSVLRASRVEPEYVICSNDSDNYERPRKNFLYFRWLGPISNRALICNFSTCNEEERQGSSIIKSDTLVLKVWDDCEIHSIDNHYFYFEKYECIQFEADTLEDALLLAETDSLMEGQYDKK